MGRYTEIRREAFEANIQIPALGLAIYTFGNVSAYDPDLGVFAIKPSGVPYADLKPEHMVVVDLDNAVADGDLRPSSDTNTHSVLYRAFAGIRGITHTHSTYATAWAQACMPIPVFGTTHADHLAREVPCTEVMSDAMIRGDYETETGNQILAAFKGLSPAEVEMVLVACHGPFTWGVSAEKALYNSAVLEEIARMALLTRQVNPDAGSLKPSLIDKHYQRKHGKNAYYGQ
ncbi:L-ribulose-5-phosphate 4-epimerase AraD [Pseudodesulfovibrio indicus]|uniref:L-ribulose-5-phosphate 4-epimerase AraD n=1 Tax=Pseudodesulfovibrio indicus TaxID=1716143 RepID=UPI00292DE015|nr:L-ribulose-5-phosphate 4-epimerase AraD [Pseudodesulfovibrio indicus]